MLPRLFVVPGAAFERGDCGDEFERINGFGDVNLKSGEQGVHAVFLIGVGGQRDGGQKGAVEFFGCANAANQAITVFTGHSDVAHQNFEGLRWRGLRPHLQSVGNRISTFNVSAVLQQRNSHQSARVRFVIHDQNEKT